MKSFLIFLTIFSSTLPALAASGGSSPPQVVEMVIWERQNWEVNGGYKRLSLWRDGRSEVEVVPLARMRVDSSNMRAKQGWTEVREPYQIRFVRKDIYPPDVVRAKLQQAVDAGIQLLETFRPDYLDGGGTRIVVQVNGQQKETIMPMFSDKNKGTANHRRFMAVSKILNDFDADAFEYTAQ